MTELPPHDWHAPIIREIVRAYSRFRKPVYVEIGIDRGYTLAEVAPAAYEVHAVDITFENLDAPFPVNANRWEMTSDEFFAKFKSTADVIFIDGDHVLGQVAMDVTGAMGALASDGTIIVHDTYPVREEWAASHCGDGFMVVESMAKVGERHAATIPLFPGLSFITKGINPLYV